jgi:hypothetical protein
MVFASERPRREIQSSGGEAQHCKVCLGWSQGRGSRTAVIEQLASAIMLDLKEETAPSFATNLFIWP